MQLTGTMNSYSYSYRDAQVLNETDVINGTCGSYMPLGKALDAGLFFAEDAGVQSATVRAHSIPAKAKVLTFKTQGNQ